MSTITRPCCALRLAIRAIKGGVTVEGSRFTCTTAGGCGQSFRYSVRDGWVPISTVDDIKDLMATHPLSVEHQHDA